MTRHWQKSPIRGTVHFPADQVWRQVDSIRYRADGKAEKVFRIRDYNTVNTRIANTYSLEWTGNNITRVVEEYGDKTDPLYTVYVYNYTFDDKPHIYADFQAMLLDGGFNAEYFCANNITKAEQVNGNGSTDVNTFIYEYNSKNKVNKMKSYYSFDQPLGEKLTTFEYRK